MAIAALLREALEVPCHTERAGVAEVVERVGEDRYTTRVEPPEELDDGEKEIQEEGNEDIPLRMMMVVMMVMMVMSMAVTVSVAMGMTVVVTMSAVVVVVTMFVSTHVSVLMLVLVGLHRSCLRYVN